MAAANPFGDLAFKYVLADDVSDQVQIAKAAVELIDAAASTTPVALRNTVGQWVASINQWLGSQADEEDDFISRAKALGFLARTLEHLGQGILRADQVKLLIGFFCSLFASDHRAGIEPASKALSYLAGMTAFQPSSGNDIITGIIKLGPDDFKRQTPTTRLEIYQLSCRLLQDPLVANDLSYQHGSTSGFMTALVDLCKNERDPQNLVVWFEILKIFLENFDAADEITEEVFKTFSAYFPITLRASATPSGITVDDLKRSLRSCFSAHHRIARLAIPFLLNKLDQGEAVTMSVKVDILQTLQACLAQYENVQQGLVPYVDQIWSSLKYEVRNGEIRDSIEATLKTLSTLARRLQKQDLQTFLAAVWIDLSDDLSNEAHTQSAGQLLAAISGSSRESFATATKLCIPHITATLRQTRSPPHQCELLGVLNALLQVRAVLTTTSDVVELEDELFGDALFNDIYAPFWSTWTQSQYTKDRSAIIAKLIDGMASMVVQQPSTSTQQRLCSEATCNRVFTSLGTMSIISPLEDTNVLPDFRETELKETIPVSTNALGKLAPLYPNGYRQLLGRFLESLFRTMGTHEPSTREIKRIQRASARITWIGHADTSLENLDLTNTLLLATALLQAFHRLARVSPVYADVLVPMIHMTMFNPLESITGYLSAMKKPMPSISEGTDDGDWLKSLVDQVDGLPQINKGNLGDLDRIMAAMSGHKPNPMIACQGLLRFFLFILVQLCRSCFDIGSIPKPGLLNTPSLESKTQGAHTPISPILADALGCLASTVFTRLTLEDQVQLELGHQAFLFFAEPSEGQSGESLFEAVAKSDRNDSWVLCKQAYEMAPMVFGFLEGMRPRALIELFSHGVLENLCRLLTSEKPLPCSADTRKALNGILASLANKHSAISTLELSIDRLATTGPFINSFTMVLNRAATQNATAETPLVPDTKTSLDIFQSLMWFLAGDIANYRPGEEHNLLLRMVADNAPSELTMGRQLARCFSFMVAPTTFLSKDHHAVVKKLRGQWIYNFVVRSYLDECFVRTATQESSGIDDRMATNRSVATFAVLQHLDYAIWRSDSATILKVVIRALQTFGISKDINIVLDILLKILAAEPDLVQGHLRALITGTLSVYEMARNVFNALQIVSDENVNKMSGKEGAMCRKSCLEFLKLLPKTFDTSRHNLLPERQAVLRVLSKACGDPVREVREVAIEARKAWDSLS